MSLQTRIESLVLRLAAEFNSLHAQIGTLAQLSTTDKTSLVAAINTLRQEFASASGGTLIDDSQATATTTFSGSRIVALLDTLRSDILGGADAAFDTLKELQSALQDDESGLVALLAAIDQRLRFDAAQTLSPEQQAQARQNIGALAQDDVSEWLGDPDINLVAIFEAALTPVEG